MKNKTILISGASVAGPALAYWLSRYGFNPTVVERAPAVRPGGYAVDFRGASMTALERMGIVDEIRKLENRRNYDRGQDKQEDREYAGWFHKRRTRDHAW